MASADALSSLLRDVPETVIGDNPYVAMAKAFAAQQQNVAPPRNNLESFLVPLIQNSTLGIMQGLAANKEKENLFDYYKNNPLIQALASNAPKAEAIGPVADGDTYAQLLAAAPLTAYQQETAPPSWTPEKGKGDLFQALIGYQAQQQEAEAARELKQVQAKEIAKATAKALTTATQDPYQKLSADEKARFSNAPQIISELQRVADKASSLNQSALAVNLAKQVASSDINAVIADAKNLVTNLRRLQGDTGNSAFGEQAMALEAILGDRTAGSKTIAARLQSATDSLRRIVQGALESRIAGETQGIAAIRQGLTAVKPPPGRPGESFEEYKRRVTGGI